MWEMECEVMSELRLELTNSLSLVVSGTSDDDVTRGWENLRELEESGVLENFVDINDARSIIRRILRGSVQNIHQVPKLMAYFAKYVKKKQSSSTIDDIDSVVNDYVDFIQLAGSKNITLLVSMVDVLREYPIYRGTSFSAAKACRAIIHSLGTFQMPKTSSDTVAQFRESVARIKESLRIICKSLNGFNNSELMTVCLEAVYSMISDTERNVEPGPALIAVLELVETKYISQAVKWIMSEPRSDSQLERALRVLCHWIPNWLSVGYLVSWIEEFIDGLEMAKKYSILNSVVDSHLPIILRCVMFPMSSSHATRLVTLMLCRQSTPLIFLKISKIMEMVFGQLKRQKTDISERCLQDLVDVTKALMERFPDQPFYESLERSLPVQPRMENVILYRDERVWADDYEKFYCAEITTSSCSEHGKVGLTNLGNTCYMNSVLQALAMTRQFCQEVMRYNSPEDRSENDDSTSIASSAVRAARIMPKLQNLFALLAHSKRRSLSPSEIHDASRPEYFLPRQQQDSSEFLCHLLDVLYEQEKSYLRRLSGARSEESSRRAAATTTSATVTTTTRGKGKRSSDPVTPDCGCIKRWTTEENLSENITLERKTSQSLGDFTQAAGETVDKEGRSSGEGLSDCHSDSTDSGIQVVDAHGRGEVDGDKESIVTGFDETKVSQSILVHRVFGGESKVTYQCAQCDTSSHNTDKFRDLQLCFPEEIADNHEITVQDLMNYYLTPEKLTGDNKYRCDRCKKLCDAQRIIKILKAPSHLILTLKHFHYDPETRLRTKLRHKVTYNETIKLPVSSCDPSASTSSSPIAQTYRLYAAVVHSGYSMDYGHYFTYARDSNHNWFKFNDSYVSRTNIRDFEALEPPVTPYILFYEKISDLEAIRDDQCEEQQRRDATSHLCKRVRDLIDNDRRAYEDEIAQQANKKRAQRSSPVGHIVAPSLRRHDNSDDENPPPSSCRGPIDIPPNRFLF